MMSISRVFVCLGLFLTSAFAEVVSIKSLKEFNDIIKKDNVLVKFYSPTCPHCVALEPEYVKAAKALKDENHEKISLVEVDCKAKDAKEICEKNEISGYPTLKYFSLGKKESVPYEGKRESSDIVKFTKRMLQSAIKLLTSHEDFEGLLKEHPIVVVEYNKDAPSKRFQTVADKHRIDFAFGHIKHDELIGKHEVQNGAIVMFRNFDEPKLVYDRAEHGPVISEWIKKFSFPVLGELEASNYAKYFEQNMPILWVALETTEEKHVKPLESLKPVLKKHLADVMAVYIDASKYKDALASMGFAKETPSVLLINKNEKYKFGEAALTPENIETFLTAFKDKKLKKFFRSAAVPEKQEDAVFEIVGDTYEKYVLDEEIDVVVMFYLTYCGHCKTFKPVYEKLGELFKGHKGVMIARINGEHNDFPDTVEGYPTVKLYPAGKKAEPLTYTGERNAESVEKWVFDHATNLKMTGEDAEKKSAAGKDEASEKKGAKDEL